MTLAIIILAFGLPTYAVGLLRSWSNLQVYTTSSPIPSLKMDTASHQGASLFCCLSFCVTFFALTNF